MYRLASVVIACLMTASAASAETVTSACVTKTREFYNVVPDGRRPSARCRGLDQRIRLLEVVDTTGYRNLRGFDAYDGVGYEQHRRSIGLATRPILRYRF